MFELPLFFVVSFYLHSRLSGSPDLTTTGLATVITGGLLALSGVLISVWSFYTTYRAGLILSTGHYVEEDHNLITSGAYGFVRHPIYLGVFLIWLSLGIAFESLVVLLLTTLYVIPVLLAYIRSEERMMLSEFGEEYRRYRDRVGMVLPHLHRSC
jgi:protein-S-isoprenylcysteine O-methyltransferase Ste14